MGADLPDTILTNLSVGFFVRGVKAYPFHILAGIIVLRLLYNKFCRGITKVPGPALAAWTGLWRFADVNKGDAHNTAIRLHKEHGKLVRIGPSHVSVNDPAAIPVIYGLKSGFTKVCMHHQPCSPLRVLTSSPQTAFYPIQCISWNKKPQMNLFSTRDEQYHRDQKKLVANAFSMTALLDMEPYVDACTTLLMSQLDSRTKSVDLGEWLQYYAFDVVGELCFNKKLGFLETGGDVDGMMGTIAGILEYAAKIGQIPELHHILLGNPLFPILLPSMETWNSVLTFTLKAINTRCSIQRNGELEVKKDQVGGKDMLSKWASAKLGDPLKIGTRDVIVHLSTNVFAGKPRLHPFHSFQH